MGGRCLLFRTRNRRFAARCPRAPLRAREKKLGSLREGSGLPPPSTPTAGVVIRRICPCCYVTPLLPRRRPSSRSARSPARKWV